MSSVRSQRIFFRRIGEALSPYQLLEAFLKIYIARAHLRIERLLVGKMPFHYPPAEYENAPLERLISMFQRHSDNKPLIERLRRATKARNYIAHRVIEDYMEHHKTRPRVACRISRDLKKLEDDGYELVEQVQTELRKIYELEDFMRELFAKPKDI
jgi:hypothetical protein